MEMINVGYDLGDTEAIQFTCCNAVMWFAVGEAELIKFCPICGKPIN